jgi:sugar phosphate isomerase/epimerase
MTGARENAQMTDLSRRNFFGSAAAGLAATAAAGAAGVAPNSAMAQTRPVAGRAGLGDVWGEDFLYQWSPPENLKRDLTPGKSAIRLAGQTTPRFSNAEGTDYAAQFRKMREGGWTAVESGSVAWLSRKMPESEIREIKTQAAANDVVFYGLHCGGNIIAPDPDADRWQRHIVDSVRAAEEMGCELILTHGGSLYPNRDWAHPQNWSRESWNRSVNALKRICRDTAGSKVKIAIEAVITESVNSPWAHKRLREDVGDERITVGLDITNMVHPGIAFRMSEFIDVTFDLLEDQISYLHAKDIAWNQMLPGLNWAMNGTGIMDYEKYLVRMSRLKTNPYVLIEFMNREEEYQQSQRNLRVIAEKVGVKILGTQNWAG